MRLLVSRGPQMLEVALPIAAEHFAFSDDAHQGRGRIGDITRAVVNDPFRDFSAGTDANAQQRKSCRSTASRACCGDQTAA